MPRSRPGKPVWFGMRFRRCAIYSLLLAVTITTGCAARELDWDIGFEPASLESTVVRLEARIRRGACPGGDVVWHAQIHPDDPVSAPPELAEGTYCFTARAGDSSCQWHASGSVTANLPMDDGASLSIVLRMQMPESNCATTCNAGLCGGGGGGRCPEGRCAVTCEGADRCEQHCEGGLCPLTCSGAATCDFHCEGGGCAIRCEAASECTATCSGGSCSMTCSDAATCDFRCPAGLCSFSCDTGATCTTSCAPGTCSGP